MLLLHPPEDWDREPAGVVIDQLVVTRAEEDEVRRLPSALVVQGIAASWSLPALGHDVAHLPDEADIAVAGLKDEDLATARERASARRLCPDHEPGLVGVAIRHH
jgi:hypothetical protein